MLLWSLSRIHGSQSTGSFCSWVRVCSISGLLSLVCEPSTEKTDIATDESWTENEYTTYFSCFIFLIFEVFSVVFLFARNSSVAPFHVSAHFSTNQHLAHAYDIRVQQRAVVILEYCTRARLRWVKTPSPLAAQKETDADGRFCRTINYTLRLFKVFSSVSKQQSYCLDFILRASRVGVEWQLCLCDWKTSS